MIITLTGANFSENNIGTLNSWRIVRALQGVSTQSNVTAVPKNGSYTATFKVNDGYKLASSSVTMGGTDITSSALKWDGTTGTVTISQVAGNVYISIIANVDSSTTGPVQLSAPVINIVEV